MAFLFFANSLKPVTNGAIAVESVLLGDKADKEAGPETAGDSGEDVAVEEGGCDCGDSVGSSDGR